MTWPTRLMPVDENIPEGDWNALNQHLQELGGVIGELKEILEGDISLGGVGDDPFNCDTALLEVARDAGDATVLTLDNPLGREPVGMIHVWGNMPVRTQTELYLLQLSVTAESGTVSRSGGTAFASTMEGGFILFTGSASEPNKKMKIDTVTDVSNLELKGKWPGSTEANIGGVLVHKWDADEIRVNTMATSTDPTYSLMLLF